MRIGDLERFEIKAHTFYKMTGFLAPGKDEPLAAGHSNSRELRRQHEWEAWNGAYGKVVNTTIDAFVETMGLEE